MSITLVTEVKLTSSETLQFDNNDAEVTGKSIRSIIFPTLQCALPLLRSQQQIWLIKVQMSNIHKKCQLK